MNVVAIFHEYEEEDMRKKPKKKLHDATRLYHRDQSSKGRHVTFQNEEVEVEVEAEDEDEECVSIFEDRIRTNVRKEKSHKKKQKQKCPRMSPF